MRSKRKAVEELEVTVAVGKNGITEGVIDEIATQLKKRGTIKVRLHGESKLARQEIARDLAERSDSKLVDIRGFTVVLTRRRRRALKG